MRLVGKTVSSAEPAVREQSTVMIRRVAGDKEASTV